MLTIQYEKQVVNHINRVPILYNIHTRIHIHMHRKQNIIGTTPKYFRWLFLVGRKQAILIFLFPFHIFQISHNIKNYLYNFKSSIFKIFLKEQNVKIDKILFCGLKGQPSGLFLLHPIVGNNKH